MGHEPSPRTAGALYDCVKRILSAAELPHATREAQWVTEHALDMAPGQLLLHKEHACSEDATRTALSHAAQRARHYPLQYLIGDVPFLDVILRVTPAVLIPRPETEFLAARLIEKIRGVPERHMRCLDLGTGSGCLAVALADALPHTQWHATDVSSAALAVAQENAQRAGVMDRVTFVCGAWWDAVPTDAVYDIIVTNPPYIACDAELPADVQHEPAVALYAGDDGCDAYRAILARVPEFLAPDGLFCGEIGAEQAPHLREYAEETGMHYSFSKDATSRVRYIIMSHSPDVFLL